MDETLVQSASNTKGWRFWMIFAALCFSVVLAAIDLGAMPTALPSIIHELGGTVSFSWVSTAYLLTGTVVLPLSGKLADIFGRRDVLLLAIFFFGVGSVICATATSMTMLIGGRAVQGIGAGSIQTLSQIVVADLVPLKERGLYTAITGMAYTVTTSIGPFVGGAIVEKTTWRWLFYINIPLSVIAFTIVCLFLRLSKPERPSIKQFITAVDWLGNLILMGSTTSCVVALSWAGALYPWVSYQVLFPLLVGIFGLGFTILFEFRWAKNPMIPQSVLADRTSISGYFGSFVHCLIGIAVVFYMPTYFQAVKLASPLQSGIYNFPMVVVISPAAIMQGIIVKKTGYYKRMNFLGWFALLLGLGLFLIFKPTTSIGTTVPVQMISALGIGFLYTTTYSVLASIDPKLNATTLSFLVFIRTFAQPWGIALGATVLQNSLRKHLPPSVLSTIDFSQDFTYSLVPSIRSMPEPQRSTVQEAFASSLHLMWIVLLSIGSLGFISVFLQREIPLHSQQDKTYGLEEKSDPSDSGKDVEKQDTTDSNVENTTV